MKSRPALGLAIVRISIGLFFVAEGLHKLPWLRDASILGSILHRWAATAAPLSRWYLEHVAIPGQGLLARAVPLAEISVGVALIFGVWVLGTSVAAFLMVLNYHVASGALMRSDVLIDASVVPLLGTLLGLAIISSRQGTPPER